MGEYRSRLHKAMTSLFSLGGLWILPPPPPLLQTSQSSPQLDPEPRLSPLRPPPGLHRCPVTACRCCVRVSSAGAVWSECVVSSSAERLLTGWMRESNAVYFNLFRMPELCPEFLLSLIPLAPASIPRSCSPLLGGALQGCCLWSPSRSELLMALLSTVLILLSLCQDI